MHWSDTPKRALAFAKLPDSGEWLEDVRAGMSILTGTLVPIFSETKDGTEYTKLTSPDLCTVLVTWNLNVPYVCMYVCMYVCSGPQQVYAKHVSMQYSILTLQQECRITKTPISTTDHAMAFSVYRIHAMALQ